MNSLEKIIYMLQGTMNRPKPYGWFHILFISLTFLIILLLFKQKAKYNEKQLKIVLGIYGIVALILELLKQIVWAFNYDPIANLVNWDYQWYAFPFQFCTTPIFVSLICLFLKKCKIRDTLLSYMAYFTILGSIITMILPESCFVETTLVNIHTMFLHCGSFVVSIYLLMTGEVKINRKSLFKGFIVFLIFVFLAELLNACMYNLEIIKDETFNMFYISPYFISHLPVFSLLQEKLPFIVYLLLYILIILLGANIIYGIVKIFIIKKERFLK